jgi:hypothetical protein
MTVVVALLDPPPEALPALPATAPLDGEAAAALYRAMAADQLTAAASSGGEVLLNYPDPGRMPDSDPETWARDLAAGAEGVDPEALRFEVQAGSDFSARAGNALTHLLREEEAASAAVVDGRAPFLARTDVDTAAMRLRRNEVVLAPGLRGAVAFAGFAETLDFADAWAAPGLRTLARRAGDAGLETGVLPRSPTVRTGEDLLTVVAEIEARRAAGRPIPTRTAAWLDETGLSASAEAEDAPALVGGTDSP